MCAKLAVEVLLKERAIVHKVQLLRIASHASLLACLRAGHVAPDGWYHGEALRRPELVRWQEIAVAATPVDQQDLGTGGEVATQEDSVVFGADVFGDGRERARRPQAHEAHKLVKVLEDVRHDVKLALIQLRFAGVGWPPARDVHVPSVVWLARSLVEFAASAAPARLRRGILELVGAVRVRENECGASLGRLECAQILVLFQALALLAGDLSIGLCHQVIEGELRRGRHGGAQQAFVGRLSEVGDVAELPARGALCRSAASVRQLGESHRPEELPLLLGVHGRAVLGNVVAPGDFGDHALLALGPEGDAHPIVPTHGRGIGPHVPQAQPCPPR
mmetsp:Transcript_74919/g.214631  ORF Transcript_74919/g.214631 Transcript_74919/m.214631 type:complete len:334 (-) Transcript_74919:320-1321(-)